MKLTTKQLKQMIKEELGNLQNEAFGRPEMVIADIQDKLKAGDCKGLAEMTSKFFTGEVKKAYDAAMEKCDQKKDDIQ